MTNITVGFSTTDKLISRFIRFITRAKVSHAWVSFYDSCLDTRLIMQAEAWGYEVRPVARWEKENTLVSEFLVLSDNSLDGDLRWVAGYLGVKYDWVSAVLSGLGRVGNWVKKLFKGGVFGNPRRFMCSEATIRFLQHAKIACVQGLDPETTTPAQLLALVSKSGEFKRLV